jgi:uncharacterized protein
MKDTRGVDDRGRRLLATNVLGFGAPHKQERDARLRWAARIFVLLLVVWSVLIEPRWVAQRFITRAIPGWRGPEGLKVVLASDWHFTDQSLWRVMTASRARAIVAEINAAKPDVILLPGDFIAHRGYDAETGVEEELASVLGDLKARLGVFAVLGNHDWWHGGEALRAALKRHGVQVLENEAVPLASTELWLAGIGDDFTAHAAPRAAVAKVPPEAPVLVMMHDPASFMELPPVRGLAFAGHTHGGQVALPLLGALIVPGRAPREWAYGWVHHGESWMYVTSGLGVSILPVRFNMRPEWVMFTLRGGE